MKVILFGATGMVGISVLRQCILDASIEKILCIGRKPPNLTDRKIENLICEDMFDVSGLNIEIKSYDACFFCLGVSSAGMSEVQYTHVSYDLTLAWAKVLAEATPQMRFLYVSGMGTGGKSMWARVKGRVEQDLLSLFPEATMIRLGALRPMHGERSKAPGIGLLISVLSPLWPILQWLLPAAVITTEEFGRAMIAIAQGNYGSILRSADLVAIGRKKTS